MKRGRKRGSRAHRARFPFARFITRCHLPCLRRYTDSDTNSDIQCDSLLYSRPSWGQNFSDSDSGEDTNLTEPQSESSFTSSPLSNQVCPIPSDPVGVMGPASSLPATASMHPLRTVTPPPAAGAQDVTISNSAPSLSCYDGAAAASGATNTRSCSEEPRSSTSMNDVRFGLHNRFRLPLSPQYHCWQNMFGQHRSAEFPKRESNEQEIAVHSFEIETSRPSRGQRSRPTSGGDFNNEGHNESQNTTNQSQNFLMPQRLLPTQCTMNNLPSRPSRSSWIMDLPLGNPVNNTSEGTMNSTCTDPFLTNFDTLESRSTSSGSSLNQSLFEGNPFLTRAQTSDADNWLLSIRSHSQDHSLLQSRTGVIEDPDNSIVVTLQDESNLNTESSTDPPLPVGGNPFTLNSSASEIDTASSYMSTTEGNTNTDLRNPLEHLFQDPTITDTLRSNSSGSVSTRSVEPAELEQLESLLNHNRDHLAMLFDARSHSNSSRSTNSSNTSSLLRQGSVDLQDWYFYDPRMAPGHQRGHLIQGILNLPEVISPPSYDEIIQQQVDVLPPYVDIFNHNVQFNALPVPEEAPPPYSGSASYTSEAPPPYETGSESGSSAGGSGSLSNTSTGGHMILQEIYLPMGNDDVVPPSIPNDNINGSPEAAGANQDENNLSMSGQRSADITSPVIGAQSMLDHRSCSLAASESPFGSGQGSQRPNLGLFGGRPPVRWNGGMRVDRWASTRCPNWLP